MIYYFSGEGNTKFAAKKIAAYLKESLHFIPLENPGMQEFEGDSLGIMFPVYSWGVPVPVMKFIEMIPESFINDVKRGHKPVWMVCTCGDETGNAPEMFYSALEKRGLTTLGAWSLIMPNTYVLLPGFNTDSQSVETEKLDNAPRKVLEIAEKIKNKTWEKALHYGSYPRLKTKLVYPLFKKWGINRNKWNWTQECIQCGKCAKSCPMNNIKMKGNHPVWGNNCVSCLACYHNCPVHAVAYGKVTERKGQYICPL